mmetsp:Transcript_100159/g.192135  ORF Transcript_100159/g.192135 Transcript_100159/m.192135 type:complete len:403 (-) Transcript_100159:50-1258(-)
MSNRNDRVQFVAGAKEMSKNLYCCICLGVFHDPVSAFGDPCDCSYCRECIKRWLASNRCCPLDQKPMNPMKLRSNKLLQSFIDEQEVYCRYRDDGCFWSGRYDEQQFHMSKCLALKVLKQQDDIMYLESRLAIMMHQKAQLQHQFDDLKKSEQLYSWLTSSVRGALSTAPVEVRALVEASIANGRPGSSSDVTLIERASAREKRQGRESAREKKQGSLEQRQGSSSCENPWSRKHRMSKQEWDAQVKGAIKEGVSRGVEIRRAANNGLEFFCTKVDHSDGDVELLVECMKAMNAGSDPSKQGCTGHVGKMIFSAGQKHLALSAYVPQDKQHELTCEEWLQEVLDTLGGTVGIKANDICTGWVMANPDDLICESLIRAAYNFLHLKGQIYGGIDEEYQDDSEG